MSHIGKLKESERDYLMPDNEKEPEIDGKLNVNVYVPTAATKAIIEALPPTTSIEDRKTIAEMLKQHEEETRKSFKKERGKSARKSTKTL